MSAKMLACATLPWHEDSTVAFLTILSASLAHVLA